MIIENVDSKRTFNPAEIAQCAKDALDNWDFDIEADMDRSPEFIQAMQDALDIDEDGAVDLWCQDGDLELSPAFGDIWDMLYEFSQNMASQS